jgi:hypothetical protein
VTEVVRREVGARERRVVEDAVLEEDVDRVGADLHRRRAVTDGTDPGSPFESFESRSTPRPTTLS